MPKGHTWLPSSPTTTTTMLMLLCYVVVMLFTPKRPSFGHPNQTKFGCHVFLALHHIWQPANCRNAKWLCGLLAGWLAVCQSWNMLWLKHDGYGLMEFRKETPFLFAVEVPFVQTRPEAEIEVEKGRMACRRTVRQPKNMSLIYIICLITTLFPRSLERIWLKLQVIRCAFDRKPKSWGKTGSWFLKLNNT